MARMKAARRPSPLSQLMAEPIRTPGFPQIVVTRGFAYQWLRSLGWSESERGFGSLDCRIFAAPVAVEALTPEADRDYWLGQVAEDFRRERAV